MRDRRGLRSFSLSWPMWAVLATICVVLLAVGSNHPAKETAATRVAYLENVLKCPSCASASLAQSETIGANELKATIRIWVDEGMTNQAIEDRLVATYGQGELLRPTSQALWITPVVIVGIAVLSLVWFLLRRRDRELEMSLDDEQRVLALLRERSRSEVTSDDEHSG